MPNVEYQLTGVTKGQDHAEKTYVGGVFLFGYSGFILTESIQDFALQTFLRDGLKIEIEPPKRLAAPTWRPIPQLTKDNLPRLFPSAPPSDELLRLAAIPSLDEAGEPSLQLHWGDGPENWKDLPQDTIAAFVYGEKAIDSGGGTTERLLEELFGWLRVQTLQWWIGRSTEGITGNHHLILPMVREREVRDFPIPYAKQTSPTHGAKRVTPEIWAAASELVRSRKRPNASDVLILDATYFYYSGNVRIAIIVLASSFEMGRDEALDRVGISKKKLKASDTDILKHLSLDFAELVRRNLAKENPEAFEFLKSLWIARGHVAHGKELVWRVGGKPADFSKLKAEEFFRQAETISAWLKSI